MVDLVIRKRGGWDDGERIGLGWGWGVGMGMGIDVDMMIIMKRYLLMMWDV